MSQIIKKLDELEGDKSEQVIEQKITIASNGMRPPRKSKRTMILGVITAVVIVGYIAHIIYKVTRPKPKVASREVGQVKMDRLQASKELIKAYEKGDYKLAHTKMYLYFNQELEEEKLEALNNLAVIYRNLNEYDRAIETLNKALEQDEQNAVLHNNIGVVLLAEKKFELARDSFERALDIDPDYSEALLNMGITYEGLKEWILVEEFYKKYIKSPKSKVVLSEKLKKRLIKMYPLLLFYARK